MAWVGVPAGVHRFSATHPTTRFASFVGTCKPGRIVNANPPWGLHELGGDNPTGVVATWQRSGTRATLRTLDATRLPAHATVAVGCTGRGCAAKPRTIAATGTTLDVASAMSASGRTLKAGQTPRSASRPRPSTARSCAGRSGPGRPRGRRSRACRSA